MTDEGGEKEKIGYRRPPISTRFRKGESGNPRGRPKGSRDRPPYEAVLGQTVTVYLDGRKRRVSATEAFLLHLRKRALNGDSATARAAMAALDRARAYGSIGRGVAPREFRRVIVAPGSVSTALEPLRIATKLDRFRPTARMMLEPKFVEMALTRLGIQRLTVEQQRVVVQATRTPWKVRWPAWWEAHPKTT